MEADNHKDDKIANRAAEPMGTFIQMRMNDNSTLNTWSPNNARGIMGNHSDVISTPIQITDILWTGGKLLPLPNPLIPTFDQKVNKSKSEVNVTFEQLTLGRAVRKSTRSSTVVSGSKAKIQAKWDTKKSKEAKEIKKPRKTKKVKESDPIPNDGQIEQQVWEEKSYTPHNDVQIPNQQQGQNEQVGGVGNQDQDPNLLQQQQHRLGAQGGEEQETDPDAQPDQQNQAAGQGQGQGDDNQGAGGGNQEPNEGQDPPNGNQQPDAPPGNDQSGGGNGDGNGSEDEDGHESVHDDEQSEHEEDEDAYTEEEIAAAKNLRKSHMSTMSKKLKSLEDAMKLADNVNGVRWAMVDADEAFTIYVSSHINVVKMIPDTAFEEREAEIKIFKGKESFYNYMIEMAETWVKRVEKKLADGANDSVSMVGSSVSKSSSKASGLSKTSKMSKKSTSSKHSSSSCCSKHSKASSTSKTSTSKKYHVDPVKAAQVAAAERMAGIRARMKVVDEEQLLKNKLEKLKLVEDLEEIKQRNILLGQEDGTLHGKLGRSQSQGSMGHWEKTNISSLSSIKPASISGLRGDIEIPSKEEFKASEVEVFEEAAVGSNLPRESERQHKQDVTKWDKDARPRLGSDLNPHAQPWVEDRRPRSESGCVGMMGMYSGTGAPIEQYLAAMQLPTRKIPTFSGEPLEFKSFMKAFETRIASKLYTESDCYDYLLQYLGGDAKELVKDMDDPPNYRCYSDAKLALEKEFGNPSKIAATYEQTLLNWSKLQYDDPAGMKKFSLYLSRCVNAMAMYEDLTSLNHIRNLQLLQEKFPPSMQNRWCDHATQIKTTENRTVKLVDMARFVDQMSKSANNPDFSRKVIRDLRTTKAISQPKTALEEASGFATGTQSQQQSKQITNCAYCGDSKHHVSGCKEIMKISLTDRKNVVTRKGLCYGCLDHGHRASACKQRLVCSTCLRRHPTILHDSNYKPPDKQQVMATVEIAEPNPDVAGPGESKEESCMSTSTHTADQVIYHGVLPVLISSARNPGHTVLTYCLFDNGSTGCFATDELLEKLGVEGTPTALKLKTMHGCTISTSEAISDLAITDIKGENKVDLPRTFSRKEIPVSSQQIPRSEVVEQWPHLRAVSQNMPKFYGNVKVGLLVGSNCPLAMQPLEMIPTQDGSPYALRLRQGWTLYGPVNLENHDNSTVVNRINVTVTDSIEEMVIDLFERDFADTKGAWNPTQKMPSVEDERFVHVIEEGLEYKNGKFSAPLPVRHENLELPDNRLQAISRLMWQKKKMEKNQQYQEDYSKFMQKLIEKGYAREIDYSTDRAELGYKWYLPHHGVYHPTKGKLRVVLDCSAECRNTSLNGQLLRGPNYINGLVGVLLRFRRFQIAFSADVESMFYQIGVPVRQQQLLRFLWWPGGDLESSVKEFCMTVHPFGAISSPSVANYVLKHTGRRFAANRLTREVMENDFYVDDVLCSCASVEEASDLCTNLKKCCSDGGFNLTKFTSNSKKVLRTIPEGDRTERANCSISSGQVPTERALGVEWDVEHDSFQFSMNLQPKPFTRRGVLSTISAIYDPLGFIGPIILPAKKLLQTVCKSHKLDWNTEIPAGYFSDWKKWTEGLQNLEQIRIPRCIQLNSREPAELHLFSDASITGLASVCYARQRQTDGSWTVTFVMGKVRVTPVKAATTIPKLELAAAALSAELSGTLRQELRWTGAIYFHTDSEAVLKFINSEQQRQTIYVANRVRLIRSLSSPKNWAYVNTKENPADEGSRGTRPEKFGSDSMWLQGPAFLKQHTGRWSTREKTRTWSVGVFLQEEEEVKIEDTIVSTPVTEKIDRSSNWQRLVRVICRVRKFISIISYLADLAKGACSVMPGYDIQLHDFEATELVIIAAEQGRFFKGIKETDKVKGVPKQSPIKKLDPFIEGGIIRVGGRLQKADIGTEAKHPIVLAKRSNVTKMLIRDTHKRVGHMGTNQVLAEMRQKYWIVGGGTTVRNAIVFCIVCRKTRGRTEEQKMAELPQERVTVNPPFTHTGLDCFGPFMVKHGRKEAKRYGALFTCLSSRSIHLEALVSMETDTMINAIRRFIARRGSVSSITSDNGSNFIGADNELSRELRRMDDSKLKEALMQNKVTWNFIPPLASHQGGVWERQIQTVKRILANMLQEFGQRLTDEVLTTMLCEVETIVNSRPLTAVSGDPKDPLPISPNTLLTLKTRPTYPPPGEFERADMYGRKRWRQTQYLADIFWSRWRQEYLPLLQSRPKWLHKTRGLKINDVVILQDETAPRCEWDLGRVTAVHDSHDQAKRSFTVRTCRKKAVNRAINQLVLLVPSDND